MRVLIKIAEAYAGGASGSGSGGTGDSGGGAHSGSKSSTNDVSHAGRNGPFYSLTLKMCPPGQVRRKGKCVKK